MSINVHSMSAVRSHGASHHHRHHHEQEEEEDEDFKDVLGTHLVDCHEREMEDVDQSSVQQPVNSLATTNSPSSCYSQPHVTRMQRRLRFFFMNPVEKWIARHRFPWKLLVQVFKIIVVTLQVALFGNARYSHITFYNDNTVSLSHLFLNNWEDARDVKQYPPALGEYAVYTKGDLYRNIDFAVTRYANLPKVSVGSYDFANPDGTLPSMRFCKSFYKKGEVYGFNQSYSFDNTVLQECLDVFPLTKLNGSVWSSFNSEEYFRTNNFSLHFNRLIKAELSFALKGVLLKSARPLATPDCFTFNITILYDNFNHNGQIVISLVLKETLLFCHGVLHGGSNTTRAVLLDFLNGIVITISALSLLLCSRAIYRAQMLKMETMKFFKNHFNATMNFNEKLEFLNLWYVLIIINDVLIILGSIIKIQIENNNTEGDLYNACSVLLGIGTLLVWFGVLRYLSFFPKYNILILTMRRAAPDVLRFLLCALLIYAGFVFNGWIILGPYHIKFRTLSSSSECLFSLINGDDMFATFAILLEKSPLIWWYSRIYFYVFISLFIYVVISLFIAVIMDSYDTIKNYHMHGFPKTFLMKFVSQCSDDASSGLFKDETGPTWKDLLKDIKLCSLCVRRRSRLEHYEPL